MLQTTVVMDCFPKFSVSTHSQTMTEFIGGFKCEGALQTTFPNPQPSLELAALLLRFEAEWTWEGGAESYAIAMDSNPRLGTRLARM
ncbi:hypothetical protein V6N13_083159 [Hibiscus sabdariffa]|uniref:Uncharacterized protein n=1 Tax=Hibiscus sabdariffa TaxID=183260 RepID=A0ABR2SXV5_9ROSI